MNTSIYSWKLILFSYMSEQIIATLHLGFIILRQMEVKRLWLSSFSLGIGFEKKRRVNNFKETVHHFWANLLQNKRQETKCKAFTDLTYVPKTSKHDQECHNHRLQTNPRHHRIGNFKDIENHITKQGPKISWHTMAATTTNCSWILAPRGFGDLWRMASYFQGSGEHW